MEVSAFAAMISHAGVAAVYKLDEGWGTGHGCRTTRYKPRSGEPGVVAISSGAML